VTTLGLYYEDVAVGAESVSPGRTVTETDVVNYAGLSGDYQQIHTNVEFAEAGPFGQRLVHGPLGFTIAMGLSSRMGMFEGTAVAALGIQEWRFRAPIFIGDTVHLIVVVEEKRVTKDPSRGILNRRLRLVNQRGETVQEGLCPMMVLVREPASVSS
jgi:acyl dehydratase